MKLPHHALSLALALALPGVAAAEQAPTELDELHRQMAAASFYKGAPADIQAATARLAEIPPELDRLYARWGELESGGGA